MAPTPQQPSPSTHSPTAVTLNPPPNSLHPVRGGRQRPGAHQQSGPNCGGARRQAWARHPRLHHLRLQLCWCHTPHTTCAHTETLLYAHTDTHRYTQIHTDTHRYIVHTRIGRLVAGIVSDAVMHYTKGRSFKMLLMMIMMMMTIQTIQKK